MSVRDCRCKEDTMKNTYHLCMGRDREEPFSLPARWRALDFAVACAEAPNLSVEQMAEEALSKPVRTPPLKDLVKGRQRIAVIIDDGTRPTPVSGILGVLLPYLADNGVPRENVTIVVALGTHAPMAEEGLRTRVGIGAAGYRLVQHNAWQADLVPVRLPDGDAVVKINPEVAHADVKIGISSILPHPMAGYGGGPKIIMPGVANFEYIRYHHMKLTIDPGSAAGRTKGNPFHEGCMKTARAVGLDFSINCIYNRQGEIMRIIGGSLDEAFAEAVDACFEVLGARFEEKVDITITSTYPHTHAHQFIKGLSAPDVVTKETGAILLAVPTVAPLADEFVGSFDVVKERSHEHPAPYVREAMTRGEPFLPDKALEFNMAMKCAIIRPKTRVILVSPMISEKQARVMGFEYASSIAAGVKMLEGPYPDAKVAIFPSGGLIVPVTAWES
jgi:nickel-dependent lactate racemase